MATPNVLGAYDLLRQAMQQGATPTVAPGFGPYDPASAQGGLIGRLLSLQAEQSRYQPTAARNTPAAFAQSDPNFRQLSRAPIAQNQSVLSDATPDPVRPGSQYAQAPMALCATGPAGCAVGGGLTLGQILGGAALLGGGGALLGGAAILNQNKRPVPSKKPASTSEDDDDIEVDPDVWLRRYKEQVAARARERDRAARKAMAAPGADPGNFCTNRYNDEIKNCYKRSHEYPHWDFLQACLDRAADRLGSCSKKGEPAPDEPAEWGPEEEEVFRNFWR